MGFLEDEEELPQIFVLTPEACLAQMSIKPDVFEDVGLLVFDECHLLHADDADSRRPLDAMLCVLNFAALVPDADFLLLSAMMKNTDEIAGWVGSMTGRTCLPLSLPWKPTRQLRGCVVYPQDEVAALEKGLRAAKVAGKTKGPSARDKVGLLSRPLAFFGLKQTWATRKASDYSLVALLENAVELSASPKFWTLTPNSGVVSAKIASAAAQGGIKTLIFFQTIPNAIATKNRVLEQLGNSAVELTEEEKALNQAAILELGGSQYGYLDIAGDYLVSPAVVHHGLLLPEERLLCESLFQRSDGPSVMAATPTVAQGMNFPSELVIIAEDSRFEADANKREVLEAQELLNAAGRAGRAGQNANGIVLVVPGRVVGIDLADAKIGKHWITLQKVFGQSDQCLEIDDPLMAVMDRIHSQVKGAAELERYAVARLSAGGLEPALRRTLGAYRASKRGDNEWVQSRIAATVAYHEKQAPESERELAVHQVASTFGIALSVVQRLDKDLTAKALKANRTVGLWRIWFFNWIEANSDLFDQIFRPAVANELFGKDFATLGDPKERALVAIPFLRTLTRLWMSGDPICDLQKAFGTDPDNLKACMDARRFVLRVIPELAYLFGLPSFLLQRKLDDADDESDLASALVKLGSCVRQGYRSSAHAGLAYFMRSQRLSRRQVHEQFVGIRPFMKPAPPGEAWDATVKRVEAAIIDEINHERMTS